MPEEKKEDKWEVLEIVLVFMLVASILGGLPAFFQRLTGNYVSNDSTPKYTYSLKIPPQTEQNENALLGALMTGREEFENVKNKISRNSFRNPKNAIIFSSMRLLFERGKPVSLTNVANELKVLKQLEDIGGVSYLRSQMNTSRQISIQEKPRLLTSINNYIRNVLNWITVISIAGLAYVTFGFMRLYKDEEEITLAIVPEEDSRRDQRWKRILSFSKSHNESDWKVSIIEADAILEEIVENMGYSGETLGERLKNIEKSDFLTLDEAWEAHKYRNEVAHGNMVVRRVEVLRVLSLYEKVFREFEYL